MVPCPAPVVGDKTLKTQSQVSFMSVEAMEVDPAPAPASLTLPVKRNHKLRQHYESSPSQILSSLRTCSQSVCWGARLTAHPMSSLSPTMWPPWTWWAPC